MECSYVTVTLCIEQNAKQQVITLMRFSRMYSTQTRACLDQLLIAIRSLLIVCNHVRSKKTDLVL